MPRGWTSTSTSSPPAGSSGGGLQRYVDQARAHGCLGDATSPDIGDRLMEALRRFPRAAVYAGFDATAPSLHLGHLVIVNALRRVAQAGLRPIALVGGATALIGDPSGKATERALLTADEVATNAAAIGAQLATLFDSPASVSHKVGSATSVGGVGEGVGAAGMATPVVVNNTDWWSGTRLIPFLRDVGKHFRVSAMLHKEFIKSRLRGGENDSEAGVGISYAEFSYQLLQAADFAHLHRHHGCICQVGGSDQWGNITAGIDFIRRTGAGDAGDMACAGTQQADATGETVHGFTVPLLTTADGAKFGKTAGNALWLDARRTSDHALYQYLLNSADVDLPRLMFALTLMDGVEVDDLIRTHAANPGARIGQRALADAVVRGVRGDSGVAAAKRCAAILFGNPGNGATKEVSIQGSDLMSLAAGGDIPSVTLPMSAVVGVPITTVAVTAGVAPSKAEARRLGAGGGLYVNLRRVATQGNTGGKPHDQGTHAHVVTSDMVLPGGVLLLSAGKGKHAIVTMRNGTSNE